MQGLDFLTSLLVKRQKRNGSQEPLVHEGEKPFAQLSEGHHDFGSPMDFFVVSDHSTVLAVEV